MFDALDDALRTYQPELHATLRPGLDPPWTMPKELRAWYRWRNGQPRETGATIHGLYRFVSCEEATAELRHMRAAVWRSPLNAMILAVLARRSFYSLPLLTDVGGDGYCYNLIRRNMFYRRKGERDIDLVSFDGFVELLTRLVSRPPMTPDAAAEFEYELLGQ